MMVTCKFQTVPTTHPLALQVSQLTCERDQRILFKNLNFELRAGQLCRIHGINGSGKTTLLNILAGLQTQFTGEVCWSLPENYATKQKALIYCTHQNGIKEQLTVLQNWQWWLNLHHCKTLVNDTTYQQLLKQLQLVGFENQWVKQLSAGQQRRVSLARLLLLPRPIWLLDEPLTALDNASIFFLKNYL